MIMLLGLIVRCKISKRCQRQMRETFRQEDWRVSFTVSEAEDRDQSNYKTLRSTQIFILKLILSSSSSSSSYSSLFFILETNLLPR